MSPTQNVLQVIGSLPEGESCAESMDEVAILSALDEAEDDIQNGRLVSHEKVKEKFAQWL